MARTISAILNLKDNFSNTLKKTTGNTKQFQRQLKHVTNDIKGMQTAILGTFGRFTAGIGLLEIGRQSLMLASDLQEVQNVVDTTFGQGANTINDWSKNALKQFGLSELQAKQFNGTIGALMKSSGVSSDKLLEMSTSLSGLSADFASFYNLKPEEAFDKIKSGISGETEPLKALGINMSVANLEAYALTQGIKKSWQEMSQAEQVTLRYNFLMNASKDAQGDFAKTSKSFANQLRIASQTLKQIGGTIASFVLPVFNYLIIKFNDFLSIIPSGINVFSGLIDRLKGATDIADVFYLISEVLNDILFSVLPGDIALFFSNAYDMIAIFIIDIVENSKRIGQDLATPFKTAFDSISGFAQTVARSIADIFGSIAGNSDLTGTFNVIREVLAGVLSDITGIFNFFNNNWGTIAPIISGVAGAILFFNGALKVIAITTQVVTALQVAWQGVTMACNIAMGLLNGTLTLTPLGWITLLIGALIGIGIALYQNWDVIKAKASELWTSLTTAFTSMGESIKGVWNDVKNSVGGFINYCIDGINSLINGFNSLGGITIPDWVPGVGGNSFDLNIPTIPRFATGTQYFGGGLAEIGEHGGEIVNLPGGSQVIPADKTDKILNRSGGTIVNVTVQGNVIGNHQFVNEMGEIITSKLKLALSNN